MAGTDIRFNSANFRSAIRSAMIMGLPNHVSERATFKWAVQNDYAYEDPNTRPYDWTSNPVTSTVHPDVQIPVAIEFTIRSSTGAGDTMFGKMQQSRLVLTILDEDMAAIEGAQIVSIAGDEYEIDFTEPPTGLFDVTIYRIHCTHGASKAEP